MRLTTLILSLMLVPVLSQSQETFQLATEPQVRVFTTVGSFVIKLDRARAPLTVDAFLGYVTSGFYAGTIFHRVVQGFVAQAGG
ncbi:MAG TPA: peptidylprolyl isomerase, partial [Gammaproteobacteria bacterium]|nr:peptidylprolyl isomerase [Gammaproteobacteria bacterium]